MLTAIIVREIILTPQPSLPDNISIHVECTAGSGAGMGLNMPMI